MIILKLKLLPAVEMLSEVDIEDSVVSERVDVYSVRIHGSVDFRHPIFTGYDMLGNVHVHSFLAAHCTAELAFGTSVLSLNTHRTGKGC